MKHIYGKAVPIYFLFLLELLEISIVRISASLVRFINWKLIFLIDTIVLVVNTSVYYLIYSYII